MSISEPTCFMCKKEVGRVEAYISTCDGSMGCLNFCVKCFDVNILDMRNANGFAHKFKKCFYCTRPRKMFSKFLVAAQHSTKTKSRYFCCSCFKEKIGMYYFNEVQKTRKQ